MKVLKTAVIVFLSFVALTIVCVAFAPENPQPAQEEPLFYTDSDDYFKDEWEDDILQEDAQEDYEYQVATHDRNHPDLSGRSHADSVAWAINYLLGTDAIIGEDASIQETALLLDLLTL